MPDNVSAIFRQSILQAAVPDRLRGRMQGIFTVVVSGGPRLGQMLAGSLATLTVIWVPPVVGGILVVVLVILAVARVPSLPGLRRAGSPPLAADHPDREFGPARRSQPLAASATPRGVPNPARRPQPRAR